jgi:hypothetical protein
MACRALVALNFHRSVEDRYGSTSRMQSFVLPRLAFSSQEILYLRELFVCCYAQFCSRSQDAVIRVYDDTGNVFETHEHKGEFKEW